MGKGYTKLKIRLRGIFQMLKHIHTLRNRLKSQNPFRIQERKFNAQKIFWDVAPCKLQSGSDEPAILFVEDRCQSSEGTSLLHPQISKFPQDGKSRFSNKLVSVYQTTQCHIPEDNMRLRNMTTRTNNLKFQRVQRTSHPATIMILWHTYPKFW